MLLKRIHFYHLLFSERELIVMDIEHGATVMVIRDLFASHLVLGEV